MKSDEHTNNTFPSHYLNSCESLPIHTGESLAAFRKRMTKKKKRKKVSHVFFSLHLKAVLRDGFLSQTHRTSVVNKVEPKIKRMQKI